MVDIIIESHIDCNFKTLNNNRNTFGNIYFLFIIKPTLL